MLIAGTQLLGRKYHVFGQGLMGGGLATLYFAVFAAGNLWHLIEMPVAFALLAIEFCFRKQRLAVTERRPREDAVSAS